jgi:phosphoribosylaminoimidazolecarboxamide formyltransferase/IMP cyclohydrolase
MRALISVSDKTGIEPLGHQLAGLGIEIYSTGGTKRVLETAGVAVQSVSDLTGFPEILDGRVKSLHPAVHGGILARRSEPADLQELEKLGLGTIDLVVVNLYPFEETVAQLGLDGGDTATGLAAALEQIDIGGPTLLRAAAKNYPSVVVLCDPNDYPTVLEALDQDSLALDAAFRRRLAAKAFRHVAVYDAFIAAYLGLGESGWPDEMPLGARKLQEMRYGENPQQRAAFYALAQPGARGTGLAGAQQLQGKPLSYNNILDADAAWSVASDFEPVTVAIVKHTNPCGLARAADTLAAYELALAGDPLAAFGGIVAVNTKVDIPLAQQLSERFYEIILAPAYDDGVLDILSQRPALRVLALPLNRSEPGLAWRSVTGGVLIQEVDHVGEQEVHQGRVVTRRQPSTAEWGALDFAWRAVRHVKSNAIVLAQESDGQLALVGMGAGQPSRVAAVEIAVQRARPRAAGTVLASDAFFPKADGVEAAAQAGVRVIVQPGGSQGDPETIAAADAADMAMVFTGTRHFLH